MHAIVFHQRELSRSYSILSGFTDTTRGCLVRVGLDVAKVYQSANQPT